MAKRPKEAKAPHSPRRLIVVNANGRGAVKTHLRRVEQPAPPSYQPDVAGSDASGGASGPDEMGGDRRADTA
jgi:hypothetical protein